MPETKKYQENPLFRAQATVALDHEFGRAIDWSLPISQLGSAVLLLLVIVAFVGVAQLEYANKVSVAGTVRPSAVPLTVRSSHVGKVARLEVREDSQVHAGQPLLFLDKRVHTIQGQTQSQLEIERIEAKRHALTTRAERDVMHHKQARRVMATRLAGLEVQQQTLGEGLSVQAERLALARQHWRRSQELVDQRWLSESDVAQAKGLMLSAQDQFLQVTREQQAVQANIDRLQDELRLHDFEKVTRQSRFQDDIAQLELDIRQIQASVEVAVLAPLSGNVAQLSVHPGEMVLSGSALLTLLPPNQDAHDVELLLPSHAAGQVRPGMPVRVQYSGFPFQEFGVGEGQVLRVSTVVDPQKNVSVFRADVAIRHLPRRIDHLPAGMAVKADILLEAKPLWAWLVEPAVSMIERL